jgi:hypothetical protein
VEQGLHELKHKECTGIIPRQNPNGQQTGTWTMKDKNEKQIKLKGGH